MGFEPTITVFELQYAITSTIQAFDTRSLHQRTIYLHKDISTAIFTNFGMIDRLGTRLFFYPRGPTFSMHWQTRGQLRSWRDINFTITSIIKRFPRKCSLRRTVQAGPILFCQVIGRLPRYVILKYFWNCWSLLPFDFLWILIPFRIVCTAFDNHQKISFS